MFKNFEINGMLSFYDFSYYKEGINRKTYKNVRNLIRDAEI